MSLECSPLQLVGLWFPLGSADPPSQGVAYAKGAEQRR